MKVRAAITETKGYKVSCCSSQGNKIWHAQQFTYHTEALYLPIEEEKKKRKEEKNMYGEEENNNPLIHGNLQPACVLFN